jgi:hypothetical protein
LPHCIVFRNRLRLFMAFLLLQSRVLFPPCF